MKKQFKMMSLLLGLLACTAGFVACGDDDDDDDGRGGGSGNGGSQTVETSINGTWKIDLSESMTYDGNKRTFTYQETVDFNENGTFTASNFEKYEESQDAPSGNGSRVTGTWSKLGSNQVVVALKERYTVYMDGTEQLDQYFTAHNDTLDYFFKGNAVFVESVINDGTFAYTRNGALPYSGYGDYKNNPILGTWIGEDFAWDGTPITNRLEFRSDGTFIQAMDNHQGWSEGMAGYYLLDGNKMMLINYYFISKMDSNTNDWEVIGFRLWGGTWGEYKIDGDILYNGEDGIISMRGDMGFMIRENAELGSTIVGSWQREDTFWNGEKNVSNQEFWTIGQDNSVRHWWVTDGEFREGTVGTYTTDTRVDDEGVERNYLICHWTNWLTDAQTVGEATGRGEQDYEVPYVYSKISDILLTRWPGSYGFDQFKRVK